MKIVIFGAGSIGCYVGGKLLAAGNDVVLYGRERLQKVIHQHGLLLTAYTGENIHITPERIAYSTQLDCLSDADVIILTVKSQATENALNEIAQYAKQDTCIVSLQNGVYNEQILKKNLAEWNTAGGMVPYNVVNKGQGHFHRGTEGYLIFERNYQTGLLTQKCKAADLDAILTDNIQGVLWGKLLMNLNNALNVISDLPLKQQLADRNYRRALALCIEEALKVLQATDIHPEQIGKVPPRHISKILRLPNAVFEFLAKGMLKIDPEARSSMWEDMHNGRESEIAYLNGEIEKIGQKIGMQTPINSMLIELVKHAFVEKKSPQLAGASLLELIQSTEV